jgi:hypothetical protein
VIASATGCTAAWNSFAARPTTSTWRASATRHAITAVVLTIATMNHTMSQVDTQAMLQEPPDVPAAVTDQTLPPLLARKSRMYRSSSSR